MSQIYQTAIGLIDAANAEDPNCEFSEEDNENHPKELLYSQRMIDVLNRISPDASVPLRLAVRAQHIQRWKIPRAEYPRDRAGYRLWRSDLGKFHADKTASILRAAGYSEKIIDRVKKLLCKERLKTDPDCQLLEDVICVVFVEYYLSDFSQKHDEAKLLNILRKTWIKMSSKGHQEVFRLNLAPHLKDLLSRALNG